MVSYRQTAHTKLLGSRHQLRDLAHAVKQAVLSMDMEMAEHGTL
jgi:hypothetical protein